MNVIIVGDVVGRREAWTVTASKGDTAGATVVDIAPNDGMVGAAMDLQGGTTDIPEGTTDDAIGGTAGNGERSCSSGLQDETLQGEMGDVIQSDQRRQERRGGVASL
jgi:hypothetical protein